MKKAIIAFGVGYGYEELKYFIHSCHVSVPTADLFIYVGKNIKELRQQFQDYPSVKFIRYQEGIFGKLVAKALSRPKWLTQKYAQFLNFLYTKLKIQNVTDELASPLTQFMVKRFFAIRKLLRVVRHDFIMITDLRDVIVQHDPFEGLQANSLITGIEPLAISDSDMNSAWILRTYSPEVYQRLKMRAVACAGVTIASRKAIVQYIDELLSDTYANLHKITNFLGADQAIHIRLCYEGLKGLNVQLQSNGSGRIATLHFSQLTEFRQDGNCLENRSGVSLAVIHQYDRHPSLMRLLRERLEGQTLAA